MGYSMASRSRKWIDRGAIGGRKPRISGARSRAGCDASRWRDPSRSGPTTFLCPDHELAGVSAQNPRLRDPRLPRARWPATRRRRSHDGTPAYMAPERGTTPAVDWRADAYSLGCVLCSRWCGRPPFITSDDLRACGKHVHSIPPTPSSLVGGLPAAFDTLIRGCSRRNRQARGVDEPDRAPTRGDRGREDISAIPERVAQRASQPAIAPGPYRPGCRRG
jgi:serine/threonine protein kinase